jgi:hypothetical protein
MDLTYDTFTVTVKKYDVYKMIDQYGVEHGYEVYYAGTEQIDNVNRPKIVEWAVAVKITY